MKINEKMFNPGADVYYNPAFRQVLESHMAFFRTHYKTRALQVEPQKALVYAGDLYGYLLESNVLPVMHWIIMRTSGLFSPTQFDIETEQLMMPDAELIEQIRQSHNTSALVRM